MQINAARRLYYLTSGLIIFSVILLLSLLLNNEFQYAYVYSNSSRDMEIAYKIAALWAGSEGSYILWTLILNLMGLFILYKKIENEDLILAVTAFTQALMLIILLVKNPFFKIQDLVFRSNPSLFSMGLRQPQLRLM